VYWYERFQIIQMRAVAAWFGIGDWEIAKIVLGARVPEEGKSLKLKDVFIR
jgi:hypothetical protein